ncbi:hypothetical protein EE612_041133 [Oryza sativa]|nr:hypothetical protein EE612_041133 [Oryza sativa]
MELPAHRQQQIHHQLMFLQCLLQPKYNQHRQDQFDLVTTDCLECVLCHRIDLSPQELIPLPCQFSSVEYQTSGLWDC